MSHSKTIVWRSLPVLVALVSLLTIGVQTAGAAPRVDVSQSLGHGLHTVQFSTPRGTLSVRLPGDMAQGDAVTGTFAASYAGLAGYEVEIGGVRSLVSEGRISTLLPMAERTRVTLRNPQGRVIASTSLSALPEAPDLTALFAAAPMLLPRINQAGLPVRVLGDFAGSFDGVAVTLGGRPAELLAVSPRTLVAGTPPDLLGLTRIVVSRGGVTAEGDLQSFAIRTEMAQQTLREGERTSLRVRIEGLQGWKEALTLSAINRTPDTVLLEGANGNLLDQSIAADAIDGRGTFSTELSLLGLRDGQLDVSIVVGTPTTGPQHLVNVTTPPHITATSAYAPPSSHATNETWPPHMVNVSWPPHTANVTWPPAHVGNVSWMVHHTGTTVWQLPATDTNPKETPKESKPGDIQN